MNGMHGKGGSVPRLGVAPEVRRAVVSGDRGARDFLRRDALPQTGHLAVSRSGWRGRVVT